MSELEKIEEFTHWWYNYGIYVSNIETSLLHWTQGKFSYLPIAPTMNSNDILLIVKSFIISGKENSIYRQIYE